MAGEDETEENGRRSIPSLAHALEEARARAKLHHVPVGLDADETQLRYDGTPSRSGSLLDLTAPSSKPRTTDRIELARLAVEADAARRALSGRNVKTADDMQERMAEIRDMLDECLMAVRECREMVRGLAARRDRNYF